MSDHIFFMGNPLLDISVEDPENALLKKYELETGQAILAEAKHMPLFDEAWKAPGRVALTGGAALNSARSCAFALKQMGVAESKVDYMGSIGSDERGAEIEKLVAEAGVTAHFHKDAEKPTGCCAVVVAPTKERTLTTDLAAACAYKESHYDENTAVIKGAKFIYVTGYFITSCMPALVKAAAYANENDVPFGFNFSAVFLQMFEKDNLLKAVEAADYVWCNEDEAAQWIVTAGLPEGSPLTDVAKSIASWKKTNTKRPRIAIVTYGAKPVIVATCAAGSDAPELKEYPVPQLTDE